MQTGLIALEVVSKLNQVSIDTRTVVREYGLTQEEPTKEELIRIFKHKGFRAKAKRLSMTKLQQYPLPAVFTLKDNTYAVLMKLNPKDEKLLVFSPQHKEAQEWSYQDFRDQSTGELLIVKHKLLNPQVKFGFGWFYAEILKYKRVIGEVLVGSFIIQLFGLITPLFTQVILDKVVVHHTMTTLDVLGVAFLAAISFQLVIDLCRSYIFTHTANKIDAKLGAKLFKHLFALPFSYFESRQVGNIVARVREMDNIRDFITNKSVSVIIDTVFSVVFFGMMLLYSIPLTLMVLGFVALIAILYVSVTPNFRRRLQDKFEMAAQSNSESVLLKDR